MTNTGFNSLVVSTFVDDIQIMALKKSGLIEHIKAKLTFAFVIANMSPISFYLGLKEERNQKQKMIKLSQPAYIDKVLAKFHLNKIYSVNTPMKESALLQLKSNGKASTSKKD